MAKGILIKSEYMHAIKRPGNKLVTADCIRAASFERKKMVTAKEQPKIIIEQKISVWKQTERTREFTGINCAIVAARDTKSTVLATIENCLGITKRIRTETIPPAIIIIPKDLPEKK